MSVKRNHPWEYPNCPECDSDVFVEEKSSHKANDFVCHACNVAFGRSYTTDSPEERLKYEMNQRQYRAEATMRGKEGEYNYTYDLEYANLLEFLQQYEKNYFKAGHLAKDYDIARDRAGRMFAGLHERDLIERWATSTWVLTDKGKEVEPKELIQND